MLVASFLICLPVSGYAAKRHASESSKPERSNKADHRENDERRRILAVYMLDTALANARLTVTDAVSGKVVGRGGANDDGYYQIKVCHAELSLSCEIVEKQI